MTFSFAAIADMHVGPVGYLHGLPRKLTHYTEELTAAFVAHVQADPQLACVLQLGDLIQDQDAAADQHNLERALRLFEPLQCPLLHTIGNHDLVNLPLDEVLRRLGQRQPYYAVDLGTHRVICLWSQLASQDTLDAQIDRVQLAWLRTTLAASRQPTIVFTHYALAEQDLTGNPWFAGLPAQCLIHNRGAVRQLLAQAGTVVLVLNGHLHWNQFSVHDDIPYVTLQSLVENFRADGRPAASYARIDIDAQHVVIDIRGHDSAHFVHCYQR